MSSLFPFFKHRTLAEVEEQHCLERAYSFGLIKSNEMLRLKELRRKAEAANRLSSPPGDIA